MAQILENATRSREKTAAIKGFSQFYEKPDGSLGRRFIDYPFNTLDEQEFYASALKKAIKQNKLLAKKHNLLSRPSSPSSNTGEKTAAFNVMLTKAQADELRRKGVIGDHTRITGEEEKNTWKALGQFWADNAKRDDVLRQHYGPFLQKALPATMGDKYEKKHYDFLMESPHLIPKLMEAYKKNNKPYLDPPNTQ